MWSVNINAPHIAASRTVNPRLSGCVTIKTSLLRNSAANSVAGTGVRLYGVTEIFPESMVTNPSSINVLASYGTVGAEGS